MTSTSAPIAVIVACRLKPGKVADFVRWSEENLGDTRAWEGCIACEAYTEPDDWQAAGFLERWRTRSDHEAYSRWRAESGTVDSLGELLERPPDVRYLELAKV